MNPPRYEFKTDPAHGSVYIRIWGYWSDEEADGYRDEMRHAMEVMRRTHKPWVALIDASSSPPQSVHTQRIRQEILREATASSMRRVAYIVEGSLTKHQVQRLAANAGSEAAFFHSRVEAEAWLREPGGSPSAPA